MKPSLAAADQDELTAFFQDIGQPAFRVRQVLDWVYKKRLLDPGEMRNLPQTLRDQLRAHFACGISAISKVVKADDGTEKLLIQLHDHECVESVIIPSAKRVTFCLSTQVGCPVGCYFCASGAKGLSRNMTAGEIVEQFYLTVEQHGALPDNVVFMGIGEGLLNFDNLRKALLLISGEQYIGFGARRITVSTSGWTPGIRQLADCRHQWNLAISLHAPDDQTRARIIPDKFRKPIAEILDAAVYYHQTTGRMVTFEYSLLGGLNDDAVMAVMLAELAKRVHAKVNIIPFNATGSGQYKRPSQKRVDEFVEILSQHHVTVTVRQERGSSIAAACGQLRLTQS